MLTFAILATVAVLQGTGGRPPLPSSPIVPDPTDTVAMAERAGDAERVFLAQWYNAWRASDAERRITFGDGDPRRTDYSCINDVRMYPEFWTWGIDARLRRIPSANGSLGVCPNWLPPDDLAGAMRGATDERLWIDGALDIAVRAPVSLLRRKLIVLLDSAVRLMPGNSTVTGQLVRFLIDDQQFDVAARVVSQCKALEWWCSALSGLVQARLGDTPRAAASFATAAGWLAETDQCMWTDVSALLDSAGRMAYRAMPCRERLTFNKTFWWMSDPLWSSRANDRYVEHFSRQVLAMLHTATIRDERYNWSPAYGGDALKETITRYGWPSYTYSGTPEQPGLPKGHSNPNNASTGVASRTALDSNKYAASHMGLEDPRVPSKGVLVQAPNETVESFYAKIQGAFKACMDNAIPNRPNTPAMCNGIDIGPMYQPEKPFVIPPTGSKGALSMGTTFEYSVNRVHSVPSQKALSNPFTALETDWQLNAPRDTVDIRHWWPEEHYAPAAPIVQFTEQQTAILRRQRDVLLAYSTNLAKADLRRVMPDSVDVVLMLSPDPDSIAKTTTTRHAIADRAVFLVNAGSRPVVASVEVPWDTTRHAAARSRFGIMPPAPLSQMKGGDLAMSDPVLLLAPPGLRALPNDATTAIPLMLGSTVLAAGTSSIGVYWETYGFAATDTVEISIRVQRSNPTTLAQRVAVATGLADPLNTPVAMSWQEPQAGHDTRTVAGAIPIQMRSVILDITSLHDGDYMLQVSVGKRGQTSVRSERSFVIR